MTIDKRQDIITELYDKILKRSPDLITELFSEIKSIAESKGNAYSGSEDSLDNFKRNAKNLGLSKYQIWNVYFSKHIDSINNAIKQNPEKPVDKSEGLHGRIIDAMTYLSILECLLKEDGCESKK
jgi:hypothetical protein